MISTVYYLFCLIKKISDASKRAIIFTIVKRKNKNVRNTWIGVSILFLIN